MKSKLYFIFIYLKRNKLFYITLFICCYLIYYETFALEFNNQGDIEITGLWVGVNENLKGYVVELAMHHFFVFLLGIVLISGMLESYRDSGIFTLFSIHSKSRINEWFSLLTATVLGWLILQLCYLSLLSFYVSVFENIDILFPVIKNGILFLPPAIFIISVAAFFITLSDNRLIGITGLISYVIIVPFIIEMVNEGGLTLPTYLNFIVDYGDYLFPFTLTYYGDVLMYSLGLKFIFPVYSGFLWLSVIFLALSAVLLKRKVY